jgi:hypothetical protein
MIGYEHKPIDLMCRDDFVSIRVLPILMTQVVVDESRAVLASFQFLDARPTVEGREYIVVAKHTGRTEEHRLPTEPAQTLR